MSEMLEKILSDENIKTAYKKVYANKGAGGVDGVTVYPCCLCRSACGSKPA